MKSFILSILTVVGFIFGVTIIFVLWSLAFSTIGWFFGMEWISPREWGDVWILLGLLDVAFTIFTVLFISAVYEGEE